MGVQKPIRYQGEVVEWSDEKRCGFIRPRGAKQSEPLVFVGAASMATKKKLPSVGHVLTYELSELPPTQKNLRLRTLLRAENAAFLGEELPLEKIDQPGWTLPLFGIIYLFLLWFLGRIHIGAIVFCFVNTLASILAFCAYWQDKCAAQQCRTRVPESTLQLWAAFGGWIGATVAQILFRHKTVKASFQSEFRWMVVLNIVVTGCILGVTWHYQT